MSPTSLVQKLTSLPAAELDAHLEQLPLPRLIMLTKTCEGSARHDVRALGAIMAEKLNDYARRLEASAARTRAVIAAMRQTNPTCTRTPA